MTQVTNLLNRVIFSVTLLWLLNNNCFSQITPGMFQQYIEQSRYSKDKNIKDLYALLFYKTVWIQKENSHNLAYLMNVLDQAADAGLNPEDYQYHFIRSFVNKKVPLNNQVDSLEAELNFADAAMDFYRDIAYGNKKPVFGYDGLQYVPGCYDIPVLLAHSISTHSIPALMTQLSGGLPEIASLQQKLAWFNRVISGAGFSEVVITSTKVNNTNKPLITKLYQLGIITSANNDIADSILKKKVKEAQVQFNLLADGVLRSSLLQELNTPLSKRAGQIQLSLNYYRWLNCISQQQTVIVVNIPAAYMKVYRSHKAVLEMRMVVGKRSTPTPTLTSMANEVILYPYWHVPYSIATKEILPKLKRNAGYINSGNFQVLNRSGNIVDPYSINWNALSQSYFPYLIRQSTGCDNALGLLKLNFYNPFSVYLHDTDNKHIFKYNKRYYSHGCMRMEKPMELGHLVLPHNRVAIDTLEQKGCLRNQSPIPVPVKDKFPVIVWYNPAGTDSTGRVLFFEDVYNKLPALRRP